MKTIIGLRKRIVLYATLLLTVTGCAVPPPPPRASSTPPTFSCASFTELLWSEFRFGVDSPDDVVATAVRLWGIDREQVRVKLKINEDVSSVWWPSSAVVGPGGTHQFWFPSDQKLAKIRVEWGYPKPTLAQVIDCLGPPEQYIAFFVNGPHGIYLSLALLYPDIGIVVRHFDIVWGFEPLKIHSNKRMEFFVVVPPGTAEQVATHMYKYGQEDRQHAQAACLLKPWPGSIEAMEIASEEDKILCGVR